jgi:hypothetical protein
MTASFSFPFSGVVESENQEVLIVGWETSGEGSPPMFLTLDEQGRPRMRRASELRFRMVLDAEYQDWVDDPIPTAKPRPPEDDFADQTGGH